MMMPKLMTVGELIAELQKYPADMRMIIGLNEMDKPPYGIIDVSWGGVHDDLGSHICGIDTEDPDDYFEDDECCWSPENRVVVIHTDTLVQHAHWQNAKAKREGQ